MRLRGNRASPNDDYALNRFVWTDLGTIGSILITYPSDN